MVRKKENMEFSELFLESLGTLTLNKMRTGLATLGIIIGIGSVIALISLGQASQKSVQNQIQSLGSNLLTIMPGAQRSGNVRSATGTMTSLTYDDAKAIAASSQITTIKNVSPEFSRRTQVVAGRNNTNTQIIGVIPAYAEVRKISVSSGSFITQHDVDGLNKVAVLGPQVVSDLFGEGSNPLGESIRINGQSFRIMGITTSKGGTGFQNQDDMIFVPLTTAQKIIFGATNVSSISLEAKSEEVMTQAQDEVGYFLLARHRLNDPAQADFSILSQNDILSTASSVTSTFTALLSGIAAISLIVGGIGIMNIMLVTVTERTREIGLRKALGAKKRIITTQFLLESIILTGTGGILGMIFGILASLIISHFINLPFTISLSSIALAIGVSGVIGILFGWYPANKAANLQPIEALRYE
jgi:putative ABC transport system permease protein